METWSLFAANAADLRGYTDDNQHSVFDVIKSQLREEHKGIRAFEAAHASASITVTSRKDVAAGLLSEFSQVSKPVADLVRAIVLDAEVVDTSAYTECPGQSETENAISRVLAAAQAANNIFCKSTAIRNAILDTAVRVRDADRRMQQEGIWNKEFDALLVTIGRPEPMVSFPGSRPTSKDLEGLRTTVEQSTSATRPATRSAMSP